MNKTSEFDVETWDNRVTEEFVKANLGDKRLEKRLKTIVSSCFNKPGESIPKSSNSLAESKATYRFYDNKKVNAEKVIYPHSETTKNRIRDKELILVINDTTEIGLMSSQSAEGIGYLSSEYLRGMYMHASLAVTKEGIPLGITDLQIWSRNQIHKRNDLEKVKRTPIDKKESMKWIRSFRATSVLEKDLPTVHFVNICDREGDILDLFYEHFLNEKSPDLLVRATYNRRINDDCFHLLWDKIETQEIYGEYTVDVPRKKKQIARKATLKVRFSEVEVIPPKLKKEKKSI